MSARHAALKLHSAHEQDRDWILAQLDDRDRAQLQTYLGELEGLGIPRQAVPVMPLPSLSLTAQIDGVDAAFACTQLAKEPAWVLVELLRLHPWSWRAALLATLNLQQRKAVLAELEQSSAPAMPAERRTVLIQLLHARLCEPIGIAPLQAASKRQSRLLNKVRLWRR